MVFIVEANLLGNMNVQETTGASKLKLSTVVTGSAGQGKIGPPLGVVDIGVSDSAYLFRVALPGVRKDQCRFLLSSPNLSSVCISGCKMGIYVHILILVLAYRFSETRWLV